MPGAKKCAFMSCVSSTSRNSSLRFFRFPVKSKNVCDKWVVNTANEDLIGLSESALSSRVVCERHFEKSCFNSSSTTSRLVKGAIPTLLALQFDKVTVDTTAILQLHAVTTAEASTSQEQDHSAPLGTSPTTPQQQHETLSPQPSTSDTIKKKPPTPYKLKQSPDTPRKVKLRKRLVRQRKLLKKKSEVIRRRNNSRKNISKEAAYLAASQYIESGDFKSLLKMQMLHKKHTPWKEDEKQLAIEIHYRSPSLYRNLKEQKDFKLPDKRTIARWMNVINLMPGISEELLENVKLKVKTMSSLEKQVVVMFDEMTIKKCLLYNEKRDIIEGFEDLGPLGRTENIGTHALMFLVRGLFHRWKMPVAHFISSGVTGGDQLVKLLQLTLIALVDIGLKVRAVVCDQGRNNVKAVSLLNVTKEDLSFYHNDQKIFFLYDTPHLIKCIRNNLMKGNIAFDGGEASWQHVQQMYVIDSSSTKARALCKLTAKHIAPNNFDKMKVKLATQVFSKSVKAAMLTAVDTKQMSTEAVQTAEFIGELNDIFDCLNSKQLYDSNPLKCALSDSTEQGAKVKEKLNSVLPWINTWTRVVTVTQATKKRKKAKQKIPPSFDGLKHTITSVLNLWEDLKNENISFLLTNRLSQDAIENEFSVCRQKGGFDRNPSAMKFRQNLRHRILISLMKPPTSSNCEVDDAEHITPSTSSEQEEDVERMTDTEEEDDDSESAPSDVEPSDDTKDDVSDTESEDESYKNLPSTSQSSGEAQQRKLQVPDTLSLETCSVQYVAGYLAKVENDKFHCEICKSEMTTESTLLEDNELLILHKSYATKEGISHLTAPSQEMVEVTDIVLTLFNDHFNNVKHLPNVKSYLVDEARAEICKRNRKWLKENQPCNQHREFIVNYLVRLKIQKTILWVSREIRLSKSSKSESLEYRQKLKNVLNK